VHSNADLKPSTPAIGQLSNVLKQRDAVHDVSKVAGEVECMTLQLLATTAEHTIIGQMGEMATA